MHETMLELEQDVTTHFYFLLTLQSLHRFIIESLITTLMSIPENLTLGFL